MNNLFICPRCGRVRDDSPALPLLRTANADVEVCEAPTGSYRYADTTALGQALREQIVLEVRQTGGCLGYDMRPILVTFKDLGQFRLTQFDTGATIEWQVVEME